MFRFTALIMLLAAMAFPASSANADEIHVVSPSPWADVESEAGTQIAMPYARIQQVFAAEDFMDLPVGNLVITGIIQRSDGSFSGSGVWTATRYWVRMCTTDKPVGGLDFVFENNWGDDLTTVFDGPAAASQSHSGPPGGPNEFDEPIALQHPFVYDPNAGNLLVDYQQHNLTATGTVSWDFVHDTNQTFTQAIWGGVADSSASASSGGLVWQFTVVPEPSTWLLAISGLVGLAFSSFRARWNWTRSRLADGQLRDHCSTATNSAKMTVDRGSTEGSSGAAPAADGTYRPPSIPDGILAGAASVRRSYLGTKACCCDLSPFRPTNSLSL